MTVAQRVRLVGHPHANQELSFYHTENTLSQLQTPINMSFKGKMADN